MSFLDAGLGNFAKLPPEVRLCIWDWLGPFEHGTKSVNSQSGRNTLAILRTSRALYNEVAHHIYLNFLMSFYISPSLSDYWTHIKIHKFHAHDWVKEPEDAIKHGFGSFPYHRVDVRVVIEAPDPDDGGQLIVLWQRLNQLVDLLSKASSVRRLNLQLDYSLADGPRWRTNDWVRNRQGLISVRLLDQEVPERPASQLTFEFKREMYDHEVVLLPFFRLRNVEAIRFWFGRWSTTSVKNLEWSVYSYALRHAFNPGRACLSRRRRARVDSELDTIPQLVREIDLRYEIALRDMRGTTARRLRGRASSKFWRLSPPSKEESERWNGQRVLVWPGSLRSKPWPHAKVHNALLTWDKVHWKFFVPSDDTTRRYVSW